ncbi:hypothetical protein MALGJ_45980 [Mycolicibacter algericus]|uniref:Transposase n=1 Tax=Mycolicibacter algericus TaxID=1288388 RepID=A0A7I9YAL4_MYCAL|nr:hypothetical protein MALGJ_07230 [Mycolicibacter algericus]GFG85751.1 hypothetical protein MALGJ_24270 [Mycolicibacter algericus]GFG87922.1 hypothetical protein MALGJ_45980 [Mycolicibacter algericus]
MICTYIDQNKDRFGVEPICRVLSAHGVKIAPSTYYDAHARGRSARAAADEDLKPQIRQVFERNYGSTGPAKCGWPSTATVWQWPAAPWNG